MLSKFRECNSLGDFISDINVIFTLSSMQTVSNVLYLVLRRHDFGK